MVVRAGDVQLVRTDGDDDRCVVVAVRSVRHAGRDRRPGVQHPGLRAGRFPAPGAAGCGG